MSLTKPRAPLVPKLTLESCIKDRMDRVDILALNFKPSGSPYCCQIVKSGDR